MQTVDQSLPESQVASLSLMQKEIFSIPGRFRTTEEVTNFDRLEKKLPVNSNALTPLALLKLLSSLGVDQIGSNLR